MARPIKIEFLNKPELEYEVLIRLEEPGDNVAKLKKQLLSLSPLNSENIIDSPLPIDDDLKQAETSLNYIESKILLLEAGDKKYSRKIETFLNHLYYRLERIDTDLSPNTSITEKFNQLKSKFKSLEQRVESLSFEPAEQNEPINVNPIVPLNTLLSLPSTSNNSISDRSISDLKKLSYNGKTCPRSFLQKIEEFRSARGIEKDALINFGFELFTDTALHWFRFVKSRNNNLTWDQLGEKLTFHFTSSDYDDRLLKIIKNRTQGKDEPIIIFVSIMAGMFSRLSNTLSESEQIKIIRNNLRRDYSPYIGLKQFDSLDSLIEICQQSELVLKRDESFQEPKPVSDPIATEFNYNCSQSKCNSPVPKVPFNQSSPKPRNEFTKPSQYRNIFYNNSTSYQQLFCVRCRINGHTLENCREPNILICFRCGLKDFTAKNCPRCNPETSNSKN